MVPRNLLRFFGKIGDLGLAEQQGLSVRSLVALVPVHGGLECGRDRLDGVWMVAGTLQRPNDAPRHGLTGSNARSGAVDPLERVVTVHNSPVALQTLRRDPRADHATISDPLGKAGIVAVEQRGRVAVQTVNLEKTSIRHQWRSPRL